MFVRLIPFTVSSWLIAGLAMGQSVTVSGKLAKGPQLRPI
jgi:hypothetical protein